jgi:hypothetical protein
VNKRQQELIEETRAIADDRSIPLGRAKLRMRVRMLELQALLGEPRKLSESLRRTRCQWRKYSDLESARLFVAFTSRTELSSNSARP